MSNFATILQADVAQTEGPSARRKMLPPGQYRSMIKGFKQHAGKVDPISGIASHGVYIEYTVTDGEEAGNEFREYINLKTKKGEPNPYGPATVKRRLLSAGFTAAQLDPSKFRLPKNDKDMGDFAKLIGKEVNVTIDHEIRKDGEYKGRPQIKVARVEALPVTE